MAMADCHAARRAARGWVKSDLCGRRKVNACTDDLWHLAACLRPSSTADKRAALRLMRKLLKRQGHSPRVLITDKLRSYPAAKREIMPGVEHRSHKGVNSRVENSHQPIRRRERIMKRFKSPAHLQRFVSIHDPIANLFHLPRHEMTSADFRDLRAAAMDAWREIAQLHAA